MEFIRKVFYDKASGAMLLAYMMRGDDIVVRTDEQDVESCILLKSYEDRMDELGVITFRELDQAIETAFIESIGCSVDVSQKPHALVFVYPPAEGEVYPE